MRANFGAKEILFPMPVLMIGTYDEKGTPDCMNAAWGGIGDTKQIFICLSPEHKTVKNILASKEFTVSPAVLDKVVECDYFGIASGNSVENKVEKAGFHCVKSENVNAPVFDELPVTLECKLISYDEESCHLFGEIVNVNADESVLTDGKIDISKLKPITYNPVSHTYHLVNGEPAAQAFKCGTQIK